MTCAVMCRVRASVLETASNVTATVGDTAVLPCAVSDLSHYKVAWMGAGESPLSIGDLTWTSDDRISIQRPYLKDYNLVIRDVMLKDSGQYKCLITTNPTMTRSVTLKVTDTGPRFLKRASNVTATVGESAVLSCAVSDLSHYKVVWTDKNHVLLTFEDRRIVDDHRISLERPYVKEWNLHIRDVRLSDSGEYLCQINTVPVMITSVFLTVTDTGPRFLETPRNVTVNVGGTAVLPCAISDLNDYQVVWINKNHFLLTFEDRRIVDDHRISLERPYVKDWNLHIRDVRLSDNGEYLCQVNTVPVMTTSVFLTVTDTGPRFLERASNVTATVGDTAVLPCAVSDLSHYKVVWIDKNHVFLTFEDRRIVDDRRISVERPYVKDWNLHIRDVRLSDSGEYLCRINTVPVMITSVFLTVTVAGQAEVTSRRPRYDGHDVMNGSMSYNVTWTSGQGSARLLATTHSLLFSAALMNWVCWF